MSWRPSWLFQIFISFSSTFFLLFGAAVADFTNLVSSVEASFAMVLGKFDFEAMYKANPILGPPMFLTFTISMTCVFINIFLTIIIKSFQAVRKLSSSLFLSMSRSSQASAHCESCWIVLFSSAETGLILQVKTDLMKQGNEYEVVEFLVNRVKLMTGIGKPKLNNVGPLVPTDSDEAVSSD